jgi:hypothetical protein
VGSWDLSGEEHQRLPFSSPLCVGGQSPKIIRFMSYFCMKSLDPSLSFFVSWDHYLNSYLPPARPFFASLRKFSRTAF